MTTLNYISNDLLSTQDKVQKMLLSLDITKASALDGASARMLKHVFATAPLITSLFNQSITWQCLERISGSAQS